MKDYDELKRRTNIGRDILARIRIHQYAEDLVRNFTTKAYEKETQSPVAMNLDNQMVLLFNMYDALHMDRLYKDVFRFELQLLDRFIRFEDEFRELYDNFIL
jgi:hypothetical protein